MTESELTATLRKLYAAHALQPLAPGEFTIAMFAADNGIRTSPATTLVGKMVEAGVLEAVGYRLVNGRRAMAYRAK